MLPKTYRLPKGEDFLLTKKKGFLYSGIHASLLVNKTNNQKTTKFGFVISTKISKNAVERNKIKRTISFFIEKVLEELNFGYNAIFLVKRGFLEARKEDLEAEVYSLLRKSGIYGKNT